MSVPGRVQSARGVSRRLFVVPEGNFGTLLRLRRRLIEDDASQAGERLIIYDKRKSISVRARLQIKQPRNEETIREKRVIIA